MNAEATREDFPMSTLRTAVISGAAGALCGAYVAWLLLPPATNAEEVAKPAAGMAEAREVALAPDGAWVFRVPSS